VGKGGKTLGIVRGDTFIVPDYIKYCYGILRGETLIVPDYIKYRYASAAEGNCCSVGCVEIVPGRFRRLIGNRLG
jgi:hypothetical protein